MHWIITRNVGAGPGLVGSGRLPQWLKDQLPGAGNQAERDAACKAWADSLPVFWELLNEERLVMCEGWAEDFHSDPLDWGRKRGAIMLQAFKRDPHGPNGMRLMGRLYPMPARSAA